MPTKSGWFTGGSGVLLVLLGRILGLSELYILGGAALGLLLLAFLWVSVRPRQLDLRRQISSARLHAGDNSQVQVHLRNSSAIPSPVLRITDDVASTRGAVLELPPLRKDARRVVGYRLPTSRRGRVTVGPMMSHLIDPFGLVHATREVAGTVDVLVYPQVFNVAPPPRPPGDDARLAERQASQLGRSSDEFFALRQYVVGDDLRRVHWPSSARHDDVMIRQDELPQQGRTTILLDTSTASASPDAFERMVSAAASVNMACRSRDDLVRLISTDGVDTGFTPSSSADPALDYLAVVKQLDQAGLDRALRIAAVGNPGTVVAILGSRSRLGHAPGSARTQASIAVIMEDDHTVMGTPTPPGTGGALPSQTMVRVRSTEDFAHIWSEAIGRPVRSPTAGRGRRT